MIRLRRRLPAATPATVRAGVDEGSGTITFGRPGVEVIAGLRDGSCEVRETGGAVV